VKSILDILDDMVISGIEEAGDYIVLDEMIEAQIEAHIEAKHNGD
jgi:hypothetical protein